MNIVSELIKKDFKTMRERREIYEEKSRTKYGRPSLDTTACTKCKKYHKKENMLFRKYVSPEKTRRAYYCKKCGLPVRREKKSSCQN